MKIESTSLFGRTAIYTGQRTEGGWRWIIGPAVLPKLSSKPLKFQASERYQSLHSAASAFLSEYEAYREGDAVSFSPSPEVLEALRKAVKP